MNKTKVKITKVESTNNLSKEDYKNLSKTVKGLQIVSWFKEIETKERFYYFGGI